MRTMDQIDILSMDIPVRATPALQRHGCTTAGKLHSMTDAEILALPGIGKKLLGDIRKAIAIVQDEIRGGMIH